MAHQYADPIPPEPAPLPAAVAWPGGPEGAPGSMPPPCAGAVGLARRRALSRGVNVASVDERGCGKPAVNASGSNCRKAVIAVATPAAIGEADEPGAEDRAGVSAVDPIAGTDESMACGSGAGAVAAPKAEGAGAVTAAPGAAAVGVRSTVAAVFAGGAGLGAGGVAGVPALVAVGVRAGTVCGGAGGVGAGAGAALGAAVVMGTGFEG
jgi:hypothetical protein